MTLLDLGAIAGQTEPPALILDRSLTRCHPNPAAEMLTGITPDRMLEAARRSASLRHAIPVVLGQSRRVRAAIEPPGRGVFWGTVNRIDPRQVRLTLDAPDRHNPVDKLPCPPLRDLETEGPRASDAGLLDQLLADAAGSEAELARLLRTAPAGLRRELQALLDRVWSFEARLDYVTCSEDGPSLSRRARLDMGFLLDRLVEARFGPDARPERPARLPAMAGNPLLTRRLLRQGLHYLLPEPGRSADMLRVRMRQPERRIALTIETTGPVACGPGAEMRRAQAGAILPVLARRQHWLAETGRRADGTPFVELTGPVA